VRQAAHVARNLRSLVGGCPVWGLPVPVRAYVLGLPVLASVVAVLLVRAASLQGHDVLVALPLLGAGALSVEATRRVGRPSGTLVKDLLSAWWLPMAVLLPPEYVLLAPAPVLALAQWRVHTTLLHRRVFSAASIGLAYATVSVAFHASFALSDSRPTGSGLLWWALAVATAGVSAAALNAVLIAIAVKATDPESRWRDLLGEAERLRLEAAETCLGVTVALLMGLNPVLVVFMLPPVLLLQRGLLHAQLRAVAMLDVKTGLLNAGAWEREAQAKLLALRGRGQRAAVLLIDLDYFKRVNDRHGHLVGDQVLRAVAAALTDGVRDGDLLGRFGGEEFVALLPAASAQEADAIAERLRSHVAGLVVVLDNGHAVGVTASIGVAVSHSSALDLLDLLAAADHCMYQAKAAGRNCVQHTSDVARQP